MEKPKFRVLQYSPQYNARNTYYFKYFSTCKGTLVAPEYVAYSYFEVTPPAHYIFKIH